MKTLGGSRARRIVKLLKTEGAMDSASLAARLGVTAMAVRQHLYALQQEKLVTAEERPVPLGRPAKFWTPDKRGGAAVSRRLCRAECRTHHVGPGCVRSRGHGAAARCAGRPAACRLRVAHQRLGAAREESAAAREDSDRRRVYGRGEARRRRLPLHRESLPDLRGSDGLPGFLCQRARSLPLGAGAGRERSSGPSTSFRAIADASTESRQAGRIRRTEAL